MPFSANHVIIKGLVVLYLNSLELSTYIRPTASSSSLDFHTSQSSGQLSKHNITKSLSLYWQLILWCIYIYITKAICCYKNSIDISTYYANFAKVTLLQHFFHPIVCSFLPSVNINYLYLCFQNSQRWWQPNSTDLISPCFTNNITKDLEVLSVYFCGLQRRLLIGLLTCIICALLVWCFCDIGLFSFIYILRVQAGCFAKHFDCIDHLKSSQLSSVKYIHDRVCVLLWLFIIISA